MEETSEMGKTIEDMVLVSGHNFVTKLHIEDKQYIQTVKLNKCICYKKKHL